MSTVRGSLIAVGTVGVVNLAFCYRFYNKKAETPQRVVIIGGGVMGASSAWSLTGRTGRNQPHVTLIDANHPIRGSWHESRIIRAAYEDKMYVAMVMRAFDQWRRLEKEANKGRLLHMTGILDIGEENRLKGLINNYKNLGLPLEVYNGEVKESRETFNTRFPTIGLGPKQHAVFQKDTGILCADISVQSMLEIAEKRGAVLHLDDSVVEIDRNAKTVTTQRGTVCQYDTLVIASGPWTNACLTKANLSLMPLAISNEQAVYLQPKAGVSDADMEPSRSPVVVEHDANIYAMPHLPGGIPGCKIGAHAAGDFMHNDEFILPSGARSMLNQLEQPSKAVHNVQSGAIHKPMLKLVQESAKLTLPLLDPSSGSETYTRCLYQNLMRNNKAEGRMSEFSSDFACGPHPEDRSVIVTCGYTGEGFKFGPVIGELVGDLVLGVSEERVPNMRRRFSIDNGSIDLFPVTEDKKNV